MNQRLKIGYARVAPAFYDSLQLGIWLQVQFSPEPPHSFVERLQLLKHQLELFPCYRPWYPIVVQ